MYCMLGRQTNNEDEDDDNYDNDDDDENDYVILAYSNTVEANNYFHKP